MPQHTPAKRAANRQNASSGPRRRKRIKKIKDARPVARRKAKELKNVLRGGAAAFLKTQKRLGPKAR